MPTLTIPQRSYIFPIAIQFFFSNLQILKTNVQTNISNEVIKELMSNQDGNRLALPHLQPMSMIFY